ncbi:hypothetical protein PTSG_00174 [Salpingoeca rosetta]|uniref:Helicase ATP-binding domain-containing protein n=1 Tax=Salpingoeca rosetta (strain ATCC 50818 / BSB-021) TaxID=946362 RepID=F2TVQ7_SALR5|nr:uncharacterized protein PTSG_00174 [Salpingoeca rosetta]EGD72153.1 hypothetical protein PTSG_00174 [Salpingoeca rosetta]|eukprot:XP_004998725.1 hypothetical protein PTSG_00174 [Salpingoeca rosetta]
MSSKAAASDDQKKASAAPDTTAALTTVVKVETDDKYQNVRIDDLPIKKSLRKQCKRMKYTAARAVQAACIPHILRGEDVYAAAKTGSGKTAAFALPILDRLMEDPYGIFAVVLTPTRELAYQIADQFYTFGKVANLRHCIITGGVDMVEEQNALSRLPHVVVATPGRLAAHITSGAEVDLSRVQFLVLDEADRLMTNASMQPDLTTIYNALPPERQNLLFSATLLDEPAGPIAHQLHQPLYRFAVRHTAVLEGERTRAGEGGMALSLVAPRDLTLLKAVEKDIHVRMDQFELQNDDVVKNLNRAVLAYKEGLWPFELDAFG